MIKPKMMRHSYSGEKERLFDEFFLTYYKFAFSTAYFFLKDKYEAEDLTQNFFTDLWVNERYLDKTGDLKGYLYISVKNRALNYIRDRSTKQSKWEDISREIATDVYVAEATRPDRLSDVETFILNLPQQQKRAMELVYLESKPYRDAAGLMGISINSLKSHLKIGLKSLRVKAKRESREID